MLDFSLAVSKSVNASCACKSLDRDVLREVLAAQPQPAVFELLPETHPHLFADTPVYISQAEDRAMRDAVETIERAAASEAYCSLVVERVPPIAGGDFGPRGAFMGYDFHLTDNGPRLIEINTNAGGAFLNAVACDAQRLCCEGMAEIGAIACPADLSQLVAEMFREEWRQQRGDGTPGLIAIVDDDPQGQYLYPEFLLAQSMLTKHGLDSLIADPRDLQHRNGRLWLGDRIVDLVYNRLVDFDFSASTHAALRAAYISGDAVVTPNPRNHALLADKRNLVILSNDATLDSLGVSDGDRALLNRTIPRTRSVGPDCADAMWAGRSDLFFKPIAGHGGKAVYRGDKLTRKVWDAILGSDYVAQERVAPSERVVALDAQRTRHKVDVRLYTYAGKPLLSAARLYQGQTTNFRTPGGGFAPVVII